MRSGWFSGSTWTAVPTRSRRVRLAMALATCSEAEITERDRREVDLPEPQAIDTPGLGPVGQLEDVPERRGLGRPLPHLLDEQANVHDVASLVAAAL